MALANFQFFSEELKQNTAFNIILPTAFLGASAAVPPYELPNETHKFRTLYLLHGITGDHSEWIRGTAIEYTALKHRIAVVTPDAGNSFGKNLENGANYFNFLTDELLKITESHFPLSSKREDRGIAGLSMGGYAALRCAVNAPGVFGYAASLSGITDICSLKTLNSPFSKMTAPLHRFAFENYDEKDNLLKSLLSAREKKEILPKLYIAIGTEDFLYEDNQSFREFLKCNGFELTYEEGPGGHDMAFWNEYAEKVILWFTQNQTEPLTNNVPLYPAGG